MTIQKQGKIEKRFAIARIVAQFSIRNNSPACKNNIIGTARK
jgi:hypothetical protein